MNISFKLTVLCLVMVLSSSLLLFLFVNYQTGETLEEEIRQKLERESDYAISSIDRFMYERLRDIATFSQDLLISSDSATPQQIRKRLEFFRKHSDLYSSLSYFDDHRIRIADTEGLSIGKQHSLSKYWLQAEKTDLVIDVSHSESLNEAVIHFAAVVRNASGKRIGLIVSRVLISRLYEVFRDAIAGNQSALFVALVDRQGRMLYSNRPGDRILKDQYPRYDLLKNFTGVQGTHTRHYFETDQTIYFYTRQKGYLSFKGSEWMLVMSLPKEVAFQPAKDLRMKLYSVFAPLMLAAVIAAMVMGRYFARPIVKLSRAAQEFGEGKMDVNFDIRSHKHDEIGILARKFTLMSQQLNKKISEQHELNAHLGVVLKDIEKKNKSITASITYAERIQSSLLTDWEAARQVFPDSFVLFKPRDIVSGDFYWFRSLTAPSGDRMAIVAAVDCTGHGVPGALMSVIGNNLLYQVIVTEGVLKADEILRKVNTAIKKTLRQEQQQSSRHDGMDMALCVVNLSKMTLEFAGAHRPLVYFRDGEMLEIKGDKLSLGGIDKREDLAIHAHTIEVKKGDTFYMFSDGFGDQFNDQLPSKKFSGKGLRKLLGELQPCPMEEQKQRLDTAFEKWRGTEPQTDDVTVVGVRINYELGITN